MKGPIRLLVVVAAMVATTVAAALPAQASDAAGGAVFVQTNDPLGNSIDAYHRNGDGTLTFLTSYPTGGLGGRELSAGSDPIATQGSLRLDDGLLLAVNPGSDTVSAFAVNGDQLALRQVVGSGGPFPASIATHGSLVYVVDAGGAGFVSGFRLAGGKLHPIEGSTRSLGLPNGNPPFFLGSPAQVGFTPDGEHLIVTTKTHNTVDVFSVNPDGRLSASPTVNAAGPVPFAWVFDSAGRIVLNFAGTSSLETLTVNEDNTISPVSAPVSDSQGGLCWVTPAAGYLYTSNTGSGNVSQFQVLADGSVVLVNPIAASGIPGATDSAAGGQTLYVQSGLSSTVRVFSIGVGGALTSIQVAAVPDGGSQEGIVVT
jgi:DNA-binding beta-propeller fold protein YncE